MSRLRKTPSSRISRERVSLLVQSEHRQLISRGDAEINIENGHPALQDLHGSPSPGVPCVRFRIVGQDGMERVQGLLGLGEDRNMMRG